PEQAGADDEELAPSPNRARDARPVNFLIASEPSGARVFLEGTEVGTTPLRLPVFPGKDGFATAQVTFALDGYRETPLTLKGSRSEEPVTQKLLPLPKKKASPKPGKASGSSQYKDDPYN
ncbi:PEGA domain-containing protein, partial [Pyxidicoccus fallax]